MSDRHLNLFYSYNRDEQLIENNLTRALIATLSLLTGPVRDLLIRRILNSAVRPLPSETLGPIDFAACSFALQGYMDKSFSRNAQHRYLVALAGHSIEDLDASFEGYSSIPDAWIYNVDQGYCFLIEVKLPSGILDDAQLHAHAADWLALQTKEDISGRTISVMWADIAACIAEFLEGDLGEAVGPSVQDRMVLEHLVQFLGYYGHRPFEGLSLSGLRSAPSFSLVGHEEQGSEFAPFDFAALGSCVRFSLS